MRVIISTVLCTGSGFAQEAASKGLFSLPNKTWAVVLDLPGFDISLVETKADGRRYMLANNKATGVILSVVLEEVTPHGKHKGCDDTLRLKAKSSDFDKKDVKQWQSGDFSFLVYTIREVSGVPVQQRNLFACQLRDNVFVDLHFSRVDYKSGDDQLFLSIFERVAFQDGIARTSMDYMQMASLYYERGDYARAIPSYEAALALEKQNRTLEKALWYVLIDNLAMSYGISGALDRAKEVLDYGISQDPQYPMFFYIMACVYAETGDVENTKAQLEKAYGLQHNLIPGETMPDPRKDDSFKKLLKNRAFRDFVDKLNPR